MTISNTDDPVAGPFEGDDSQTVFPFTFKAFGESDLEVAVRIGGVQSTLTLDVDYSVSLNADQNANPGGTITYPLSGSPLATGDTLTISSDLEYTQPAAIPNLSGFYARVVETALDRVTMLIKQASASLSRSLRFPLSDSGVNTELPSASDRALKALTFDASGNPVVTTPSAGSASALAADLIDDTSSTRGAGMSGFAYTVAYLAPTLGWAVKQMGGLPAKWMGVTADGTTNDTTAMQSAVNLVGANRIGKLLLPPGTIRTTAEIVVDYSDVTIDGQGGSFENITDAGVSMIKGEHTSGAVIRVKKAGVGIKNLVVSANATRTAAAYNSNCHGIHVEGVDSGSPSLKRTIIDGVRVTAQPASGIVMVGDIAASVIYRTDVDQCGAHAIVVSGGEYTGRTNLARPGQLRIENCRTSRSGGHGIRVGHTSDASTSRPYRIDIVNVDSFYNGRNASAKDVDFDWMLHGENIDIHQSATSGETDAATPGHGGLYIAGRAIRALNHRFIDCDVYAAEIAHYGGSLGASLDIEIHIGYIQNQNAGAGHYNPAVLVASQCEGALIRSETDSASVTSLASTSSSFVRIDWRGTRRYVGEQVSAAMKSAASPAVLADDNAGYWTFSGPVQGMAMISPATVGGGSALIWFSTGGSTAAVNVLSSTGATVTGAAVATAATVTDGYGTDTQLTVVATQDQNRLYLSNRTGASRSYMITLLSASGGYVTGAAFTQV